MTGKKWKVEVVAYENDEVVKTIPCDDERSAERVERGVEINMDHERFFTRVVGPAQAELRKRTGTK